MPDKKLTDNEIIKALECCSNRYDCYSCEYYNQYCKGDMNVTLKDALNLINRLQAENERLTKCRKEEVEKLMSATDKVILESKAEAYKEFAERLKEHYFEALDSNEDLLTADLVCAVKEVTIDNLLKELVGEDK